MKVNIGFSANEIEDDGMVDLLDALVKAFGDSLPEGIDYVEQTGDNVYEIGLDSADFGRAYGETLATYGWSIIGVHTHYNGDDSVDRISVMPTAVCDRHSTGLYSEGDERRLSFTEATDRNNDR